MLFFFAGNTPRNDQEFDNGVRGSHTTTRELAGLGPASLSNVHAPGLLHRLAMHGRTEEVEAMLNMREGEEYGSDSTTPLIDVNLLVDQGLTALH